MPGTYELKRSGDQFMFNLKATNGQVILTSERYVSKGGALNGIESVRKNSPVDARYTRRRTTTDLPYFVLTAPNGEVVGTSETYATNAAMENGVASVKANGPNAVIDDKT